MTAARRASDDRDQQRLDQGRQRVNAASTSWS
jgi:hypothetical protein